MLDWWRPNSSCVKQLPRNGLSSIQRSPATTVTNLCHLGVLKHSKINVTSRAVLGVSRKKHLNHQSYWFASQLCCNWPVPGAGFQLMYSIKCHTSKSSTWYMVSFFQHLSYEYGKTCAETSMFIDKKWAWYPGWGWVDQSIHFLLTKPALSNEKISRKRHSQAIIVNLNTNRYHTCIEARHWFSCVSTAPTS